MLKKRDVLVNPGTMTGLYLIQSYMVLIETGNHINVEAQSVASGFRMLYISCLFSRRDPSLPWRGKWDDRSLGAPRKYREPVCD